MRHTPLGGGYVQFEIEMNGRNRTRRVKRSALASAVAPRRAAPLQKGPEHEMVAVIVRLLTRRRGHVVASPPRLRRRAAGRAADVRGRRRPDAAADGRR